MVSQLSMAGSIDDFQGGLMPRRIVVLGAVLVFVCADLVGESDDG